MYSIDYVSAVDSQLNCCNSRAPPSTRSVSLYGSWDNFSAPYPMQRDARTGPEHWSGCHSFSNIICDGDLQSTLVPREGGLKMGGTYWYYVCIVSIPFYRQPSHSCHFCSTSWTTIKNSTTRPSRAQLLVLCCRVSSSMFLMSLLL